MAHRLPRPCLGCGTPTTHGSRCPHCTPTYGGTWQAISKAARAAHPWCSVPGCPNTAHLEADHVNPSDLSLGVQVLCAKHHHAKTAGQPAGQRHGRVGGERRDGVGTRRTVTQPLASSTYARRAL